jgi:hypothetical protein
MLMSNHPGAVALFFALSSPPLPVIVRRRAIVRARLPGLRRATRCATTAELWTDGERLVHREHSPTGGHSARLRRAPGPRDRGPDRRRPPGSVSTSAGPVIGALVEWEGGSTLTSFGPRPLERSRHGFNLRSWWWRVGLRVWRGRWAAKRVTRSSGTLAAGSSPSHRVRGRWVDEERTHSRAGPSEEDLTDPGGSRMLSLRDLSAAWGARPPNHSRLAWALMFALDRLP